MKRLLSLPPHGRALCALAALALFALAPPSAALDPLDPFETAVYAAIHDVEAETVSAFATERIDARPLDARSTRTCAWRWLFAQQAPDGSWPGADPVVDTSLALLALAGIAPHPGVLSLLRRTGAAPAWRGGHPATRGSGSERGGGAEEGQDRVPLGIELLLGEAQVVVALEVLPELRARPEVDAKADGGVGRDGALAADDAVHAGRGNVQVERQAVLADPHRVEELLLEDFPRMNQVFRSDHGRTSRDAIPFCVICQAENAYRV